ncbi:MAG: sulfurtransferase [Deltaproteobacteria bacterium HGW-Deltaproteobacteria-7]|nr:MAG: sulfurtransferase [Deltaproteobacteria bacterium HGW-Deltaproteobacteria-7]
MALRRRMVVISVLVLAACFIWSGAALAAWGDKELETEKVAVTFLKEVQRGNYKIVSTAELKGWVDQKKDMLIVDTMPFEDSFKKQHIPGAVNFVLPIPEMTQMDDKTKAGLEKLLGPNKDRLIVFYCGFTKCTRSHNGAMWAVKMGYKNVYRHPGGIKAWAEADYPVEKAK